MLSAHDRAFACDCRVSRAVNAVLTVGCDAQFADSLQSFDDSSQVSLARGFRPFAQPGERRAIFAISDDVQRLQSRDRLWRQAFDQTLVRTFAGKGARRQGDLFQRNGGGKQNAPLAQIFDHRQHDDVAAIRSGRLVERDMDDNALVVAIKGTDRKIGLNFAKMCSASLLPLCVTFKRLGIVSQLCRDECQHVR